MSSFHVVACDCALSLSSLAQRSISGMPIAEAPRARGWHTVRTRGNIFELRGCGTHHRAKRPTGGRLWRSNVRQPAPRLRARYCLGDRYRETACAFGSGVADGGVACGRTAVCHPRHCPRLGRAGLSRPPPWLSPRPPVRPWLGEAWRAEPLCEPPTSASHRRAGPPHKPCPQRRPPPRRF